MTGVGQVALLQRIIRLTRIVSGTKKEGIVQLMRDNIELQLRGNSYTASGGRHNAVRLL